MEAVFLHYVQHIGLQLARASTKTDFGIHDCVILCSEETSRIQNCPQEP